MTTEADSGSDISGPSAFLLHAGAPGLVRKLGPVLLTMGLLTCEPAGRSAEGAGGGGPTHPAESNARAPISTEESFPLRLQDASGSILSFTEPPARILSLVPSATRTLQVLGAQNRLVGRTVFDTASALAHLPSVGGGLDPSIEPLVALEPDLVIRFSGESDTATPARLDDLGIPHMAVRLDRVADVRTLVAELGVLTGLHEEADALIQGMDSILADIRRRVHGVPTVRVAYLLGGAPPWVAGPGSFIDELLNIAGGTNVFSDMDGLYGPVSLEEFLVRDLDLLLAPEGAEVSLPNVDVPLKRVSPNLEMPGPDLARAAWEMAALLHPENFR